jgi:hypothetical protein
MKKSIIILILFLGSSIQLFSQTVNGEILSDTNNVTIVKLWGTSEERGFAYGYLLGDKMLDEVLKEFMIPFWGDAWPAVKDLIEEGLCFHIDSVYQDEAKAMVNGAGAAGFDTTGITYIDVLAGNLWHDLGGFFTKSKSGSFCSTFMNWNDATVGTDLDGCSVISRHADWPPAAVLVNNAVIIIHIPSEENLQPWLMIGIAGDMAPYSGLNSSGLTLYLNGLGGQIWYPGYNLGYESIRFTFRKVLESGDYNQDSVNNMLDIYDAISSNTQGYSNGHIISALAPSTAIYDSLIALVAEVAPQEPFITFRTNSYNDTLPGDNLYAANSQIKRNNSRQYCTRYLNIVDNMGPGTDIGSQQNWELMRDFSNGGTSNLMFMQYIPEWNQLKLSVHQNGAGAYLHDPITYDVSEFFLPPVAITEEKMYKNELTISPNPMVSGTQIEYILYHNSSVNLKIIDLSGRVVATLVNKFQQQGKQKVAFNGTTLPAGIYFCVLKTNEGIQLKKMIKLK